MSRRTVKQNVDLAALPPLTAEQRAELEALATRPDGRIDYSDITSQTEAFWSKVVRSPIYKPSKTSTAVRIDTDVLLWQRGQGKGYQSRINAILRRERLAPLKS
jgi:uncharacterized protein (DUF4415 family)